LQERPPARRSNCPYGRRGIADRNNDGDPASHKVGDESRQPIVLGIGITVFDRDVAAFNESLRTERPVEHRQDQRIGCGRAARQPTDHWCRLLLRRRGQRPCRRAAESSDEFTPSKANPHLAVPCEGALSRGA